MMGGEPQMETNLRTRNEVEMPRAGLGRHDRSSWEKYNDSVCAMRYGPGMWV